VQHNTSLRDELRGTQQSFDMFANTFGSFREYAKYFAQMAQRGVRLRIVVTDFSEANRSNWDAYNNATEVTGAAREETLFNARNIRELILDLKDLYPQQVEIRLSRKPLFYTLWIRDPEDGGAMAHLGVTFYETRAIGRPFEYRRERAGTNSRRCRGSLKSSGGMPSLRRGIDGSAYRPGSSEAKSGLQGGYRRRVRHGPLFLGEERAVGVAAENGVIKIQYVGTCEAAALIAGGSRENL
jgi:hypothetical protein